ncbi:preprotein translocase SecF subunit [Amycolatopsis mediterranei S699]|uniref:Protein-export membrane protein SecF n=2 Tax=Amycolatopsis mediterranei TaxID=33910 RepID=A0A0H3DAE8_AMYMU|nr:protein translocase subunit SecF [Amycolatopsis mediterranei]ADJ47058.1 preprotein translocase SecF subunit [Amycolatopsis mediterranei U32]AEK43873.1 preprotein translocase subunit SecF [Amycolatopsis mediterranei S699]AFO78769.1 preprotein translocase SecF subunit [Amycolatopsis mediterranei S699]AGT85897.1 preprotein translocase SecF subunit [Amycolatopsis mediterranei RB]KDO04856.1 preprotein translocase subunit SecF [Amycolatopsis mediterranei]
MGVEELGTDAEGNAKVTAKPGKRESVFHRLYVGTGAFDVVGKRKRWYIFFAALVLVCLASMIFRGFNIGIEFEGGTQIQMPANGIHGVITEDQAKESFQKALGHPAAETQKVGTGAASTIQIRTDTLNAADVAKLKQGLFQDLGPKGTSGQPSVQAISDSAVSASWGGEISQKALIALAVFLVAVVIFLAIYFDLRMATAALVSLLHDILVTAGVYSLVGFEVTPATVIGLLTILGFSLYDTVVVFDKVRENTRGLLGLTRRTYAEAANLALNQTLMRSFNTAFIALLPILGLLIVGYVLLGSGTLQDLALVQLTGTLVGVLSSVALATPLLVDFKMRDPKYQQQAERVRQRRVSQERKAAGEDFDASDDDALAKELRKEKAYAAAASVPARIQKQRPAGKRKR